MTLADAVQPLDYDSLLARTAGTRFVLLAEASHGTDEFYRERAEITKRLIVEQGFTAVAAEADWPDAYRVNLYVRGASDDGGPEEALADFKRFPGWMWRNTQVVEFVDWLRRWNDALPPETPNVGFYGLDLYSLYTSMGAVVAYLDEIDPEAAERARERYACFDHFGSDPQLYAYAAYTGRAEWCEQQVVEQLVELQRLAADRATRDGHRRARAPTPRQRGAHGRLHHLHGHRHRGLQLGLPRRAQTRPPGAAHELGGALPPNGRAPLCPSAGGTGRTAARARDRGHLPARHRTHLALLPRADRAAVRRGRPPRRDPCGRTARADKRMGGRRAARDLPLGRLTQNRRRTMAVKLNRKAYDHAKSLIEADKVVVDERDDWSEHQPSAEEENRFIEQHGFTEYANWHLGIDDEKDEDTKARYKFPYGDFKQVHRCALLAAESRAGQYKYDDIEHAAHDLHGMLAMAR